MNKNFTYSNGKIVVNCENGKHSSKKYTDNIKEILEKENTVEYLENKQKEIVNKLNYSKIQIKSDIVYSIFVALIFLTLSGYTLINNYFSLFIVSSVALLVTTIINILNNINDYNDIKGYKNQLNFLEESVKEEKEKLLQLKKDKRKNKEKKMEKNKRIYLNQEKNMTEIDRQSNLYYDMGKHEKRLAKYYKLGMLKKYLNKIAEAYNDNDVRLVEKYLEENGQAKFKSK